MGYQVYEVGKRFGGYGVPCICEYPTCKKKIDRGISYACGGEPFSELGCDRYFCDKHRSGYVYSNDDCDHEEDCDCESAFVCERCAKGESPFPYKPETKKWMKWLLKDKSWAEWRKNNPEKVKEFELLT